MASSLTPQQFVANWNQIQLKETAAAASHFDDVCRLVGHPPPHVADPKGEFFTREMSTEKTGGQRGRADVYYQGKFIWEYKGPHADLDKAYQQLLLYREALGNPPLLITSDLRRIIIHTNFTNTVKQVHEIDFERIARGDGVEVLRRAFYNPQSFRPAQTQEQVTRATAATFVGVVNTLRQWSAAEHRDHNPERLAHFIIRLLFCLFAEDMDLLPNHVFTKLVEKQGRHYYRFVDSLRSLFAAMRDGGVFGTEYIPTFDGSLFDDNFVPELPGDIVEALLKAARQDWSAIDPSIFGTLFERVIDEEKRAQLGAHYTGKEDIMLIVEPVLMRPLRDQWQAVKNEVRGLLASLRVGESASGRVGESASGRVEELQQEAYERLRDFAGEIERVRVLDAASGSGNFLYVALRQLLDLQKEVIAFAGRYGLPDIPLTVSPAQLYGIEINPYAHELAQVTVWIGYIQWRKENGFAEIEEPILRPLRNIQRMDAILAYDEDGNPVEPEWPEVDVIIGNPPFLGNKKLRSELGNNYVEELRRLYDQLSGQSDLVVYWFERARAQIELGKAKRAGLIATQAIRMGGNRDVLERIKKTGDIFLAWSDKPWIIDGAAVRVSIVGFDDGTEQTLLLDGEVTDSINSNLTAGTDLTRKERLSENFGLAFQGPVKVGNFDIDNQLARKMLAEVNACGVSNAEVVKPWMNASDVTKRPRNMWIIDFGERSLEEAEQFEVPLQYVRKHVKPFRDKNNDWQRRTYWWRLGRSGSDLKAAKEGLKRLIITPRVAKHRVFIWTDVELVPDSRLFAIARDDDYFFGVLHSRVHEIWSLATSSRHGDGSEGGRPTYNNTTCFETFPFPWPPGQEPAESEDERVYATAEAARRLVAFRQGWLNPPEEDIGTIIPQRVVNKLTLTNLYNALSLYREEYKGRIRDRVKWNKAVDGIITLEQVEEMDYIHTSLDTAVLDAYGWPHTLTDEEILERLLALNLERAAAD